VEQLLEEQVVQDLEDEEGAEKSPAQKSPVEKSPAEDLPPVLQAKEEKSFLVLCPQSGQAGILAVLDWSRSN
jgi:hypothetical protein